MEHLGDQRARLKAYAAAGYDGVECAVVEMDPAEFGDLCGELGLDYVAMMFCDDEDAFRTWLTRIKLTRPVLINCHPGRDRYDFERGLAFFRNVMETAGEVEAQVVYETHRTRLLYSPWTTARYCEALPELRLCADFSHFTTVAESALQQPGYTELMDLAIARTDHIHARVGYEHGPQVPNPRVDGALRAVVGPDHRGAGGRGAVLPHDQPGVRPADLPARGSAHGRAARRHLGRLSPDDGALPEPLEGPARSHARQRLRSRLLRRKPEQRLRHRLA